MKIKKFLQQYFNLVEVNFAPRRKTRHFNQVFNAHNVTVYYNDKARNVRTKCKKTLLDPGTRLLYLPD